MKLLRNIIFCLGFITFNVSAADKSVIRAEVNLDQEYQTIEGFGASIVGWVRDIQPLFRDPEFVDFVVDELGLSMFRMQVWGPVGDTPVDDWKDISYENFDWEALDGRAAVNNDFAKALKERNPEIKIIGSIWSPPPWMKENKNLTGTGAGFLHGTKDQDNRLRKDRYRHYAKFIVEYHKYLEQEGIGLYAFGPQNEPMFTQSFESCLFSGEEYARLVRSVGKMFEEEKFPKPLFYGPEDMTLAIYRPEVKSGRGTRHNPYVENLMKEGTAKYFDIWATHGYADGVNPDSRFNPADYWNSIKQFDRPYWITEGGTGDHDWPAPVTNGIAPRIHHALVSGNVSAFVCWQIAGGHASGHNIMVKKQPTKKTYATMHYWKFIRPEAVRTEAIADGDILISSYKNTGDDGVVVVMINNTEESRVVELDISGLENLTQVTAYRTSAKEDLAELADVASQGEPTRIQMPGPSIVTVVAKP